MTKELITELPSNGPAPVSKVYLYNHLFQVKAWIGNLNKVEPHDELVEAYELIEQAQDKIEILAKAESDDQASRR